MMGFKQFLAEMPYYDPTYPNRKYGSSALVAKVSPDSEKVSEFSANGKKYHLHKEQYSSPTSGITRAYFSAVDPETNKVHMTVSGQIKDNTFHVGKLDSMQGRPKNIAHHFYNAILDHHDIMSDTAHSPGSFKMYTQKIAKLPGIKVRAVNLYSDKQESEPVKLDKLRDHYSTDHTHKAAITAFHLSKDRS